MNGCALLCVARKDERNDKPVKTQGLGKDKNENDTDEKLGLASVGTDTGITHNANSDTSRKTSHTDWDDGLHDHVSVEDTHVGHPNARLGGPVRSAEASKDERGSTAHECEEGRGSRAHLLAHRDLRGCGIIFCYEGSLRRVATSGNGSHSGASGGESENLGKHVSRVPMPPC